MVMTEPRPPRPNSIELRRSYPPEEQHLYSPPSSDHYRFVIFYNDREKCLIDATVYLFPHMKIFTECFLLLLMILLCRSYNTEILQRYWKIGFLYFWKLIFSFLFENRVANYVTQGYEDNLYGSHYGTGQGQAGSETYQSPGGQSTPSRSGRSRPSQPPPAPPSNTSSNSTPTVASANNTPTRGRSMSTGRDTLPPPPPPPGETMSSPPMNGNYVTIYNQRVYRHFEKESKFWRHLNFH